MDDENKKVSEVVETTDEYVAEKVEKSNQQGEYKSEKNEKPKTQYFYVDEDTAIKKKEGKNIPGWLQFIIIFAAVILGLVLLTTSCTNKIEKAFDGISLDSLTTGSTDTESEETFDHDYIGVLHIEGVIDEDAAGHDYNHELILDSIDKMIDDEHNKGIILYLNTPGGSVYGSDEVYFKIKEYQEKTERPVYSSMQSQCCSGGYYISAPCDKIVANRNCWTGSIGVTLGTMYDVSGLLDKLGVKAVTITAGENKAMGEVTEPLTEEQQAILQSLVDEAYEQFVGIVAEGRDMSIKEVKKLADGRVYTAKQAQELGLVDEIGTYEECIEMMKKDYKLDEELEVEDFISKDDVDIYSLLGIASELNKEEAGTAITPKSELEELIDMNGTFEVSYLSEIRK